MLGPGLLAIQPLYAIEKLYGLGILNAKDLEPCNLTSGVHPILEYSRVLDTSEEVYDSWLPAIRLASLFLTEPAYMGWWTRAAFGQPMYDARSKKTVLKPPKYNYTNAVHTQVALKKMAQYVRIGWLSEGEDDSCFGRCRLDPQYHTPGIRSYPFATKMKRDIRIELAGASKHAATGPLTLEQELRIQFRMAVTFVHEIAHTLMWLRFPAPDGGSDAPQIYHSARDPEPEDGYSWEVYAFGGLIASWSHIDEVGSTTVVVEDWVAAESQGQRPHRHELHFVRMGWINAWFRMETWHRVRAEGRSSLRRLDCSVYLLYLKDCELWRLMYGDTVLQSWRLVLELDDTVTVECLVTPASTRFPTYWANLMGVPVAG